MIKKEVLILKHVPNEGAGTIQDFLERKKIPHRFIELYDGERLPDSFESIRSVCIMGGPMNVYQEDQYPFLADENIFIKELISRKIPCLGICLGSQLIVKAMGDKVYKAKTPEIGWSNVRLTEEARRDALFSAATYPFFQVLQWHEDTFDLPLGAVLLASSSFVPHQAYRFGSGVYGFQFHVEVNHGILEDWFKKHADLNKILSTFESYKKELNKITENIYGRFFTLT